MTRQDYVRLAAALADTRPSDQRAYAAVAQWARDRQAIGEALLADNPRFSLVQFFAATELHIPAPEDES